MILVIERSEDVITEVECDSWDQEDNGPLRLFVLAGNPAAFTHKEVGRIHDALNWYPKQD